MPCIRYEPSRSLTVQGAQAFGACVPRDLCFKMSTPTFNLDQNKSEEKTMSGRPCIVKEKEDCLIVGITAINLHIKDKPQWIEFIRSTGCGETVVPLNLYCLEPWRVEPVAVVRGTPNVTVATRKTFSVSFNLLFWKFR